MKQALLIIDVQACFQPPEWQVEQISQLAPTLYSVATVARHDESDRLLDHRAGSDDQQLA